MFRDDPITREPRWLQITHYASFVLVLSAVVVSAAVIVIPLIRRRFSRGKIKLQDGFVASTRKGLFSKLLLEHIDAVAGDGEPVNLPGFWRDIGIQKLFVLLLTTTSLALHGYLISIRSHQVGLGPWAIVRITSETTAALYLFILSLWSICTSSVAHHSALTANICAIAGISFLHWYLVTLGQALAINYFSNPHWSEYTLFALAGFISISSALIPMGPKLHQDLSKLYSKAVTRKVEEAGYDAETAHTPNVNEEVSSTIFGRLMFTFVYPMISKTSIMDQVDIQDVPAAHAYFRTQNILKESVHVNDASGIKTSFGPTIALLYTVWSPEWRAVTRGFAYMLLLCPLWYLPHICLQQILYVIDNVSGNRAAVAFAVLFVIVRVINLVILLQQLNLSSLYVNPRLTTHAAFLLYQKILTRNAFATPTHTIKGKEKIVHTKADILNLISSDCAALSRIGWTFVSLIRALVELLLGCSYVWILLGPSGFWGLATLAFTFPPAYFLTKLEYRVFEKRLTIKDEKISLMQEAIQAISMIKMMATERYWYGRINEVRDREFKQLIKARLLGAGSGLLYSAAPTLVVVVAFAHYTLVAKKKLTAPIAFTAIAVFDELRPSLMELPTSMAQLIQEILSAKRIGHFLKAQDVDYLLEAPYDSRALPESDSIFIHGNVTWDIAPVQDPTEGASAAKPIFQLRDLDVTFPRGQMSLVAGKFGSGKTLLLLALLGEARLVEGKISYLVSDLLDPLDAKIPDRSLRKGGVAYVPQTPWLQSLSIRDNILFGLPMDFERYKAVIFAVGLLPDLALLDDADLTEIGERGKILSGGQKARVSLARAVYSRASVLLLDDVISAIDAQTSKHIVQHCFNGDLMKDRTIIIASHAVESLAPLAGHSIYLDDGRAVWAGRGPELLETIHMAHLKTESKGSDSAEPLVAGRRQSLKEAEAEKDSFEIREQVAKTPKQLLVEEARDKGNIDLQHWKDLKRFNGNNLFWTGIVALLFLTAIGPVAEKHALELWTYNSDGTGNGHTIIFWVALYSGLALAVNTFESGFSLFRFWGAVTAARRIHSQMLESVLRAKMAFFSKTRAGSIIQRFGEDLNETLECSELFSEMSEVVLHIIVNIVSVTVRGGWIFCVVCILLLAGVWKPGQWYRSSSRQIRRLESIIPGPINALYGETVAGTAVIRAFGLQSVFIENLLRELNMKINVTAWRIYIARWLYINLRLLDVVINATTLTLILTKPGITGAAAGFMLIFAGNITWNVNWLLINLRQFELKGVSLERTTEYRLLPREEGQILNPQDPAYTPPLDMEVVRWPSKGAVQVTDLRVRYGPDMPDILHDVSFSVEGGQRIGIVGATGGGKSTLAKAFFSFVDTTHGKIEIDGQDISQIPLNQVRSNLGIIAQDPILLSGTLRLNLDIEGRYSDQELYEALHQVQLIKHHESAGSSASSETEMTVVEEEAQINIFSNLDSEIKSGGENLSAGQKQLVVLARALLKKHKLLILDEATASIDSATDAEISRVVHEEFVGVTVLIIAHRLRTIMPCSKILVMDKGYLIQQGSPLELIKQDGGKFQSLCMAAGMEEYQHLISLAEISSAKNL